ncbi:MAG: HEAT repeat domain-containing protein [Blastocatellia bacterium]|nr:HEAT repeat domain-containing protein [Blastocatellia bacterium]
MGIIILVTMIAPVSLAMVDQDPKDLIKAAVTRPWPGANIPALPELTYEMRDRIASEIAGSESVRLAYEKLDAKGRNVEWFEGVAELEKLKAVWSLLSCLCHPHEDVQIHALRSLNRLQDKRAVPFLLVYAESKAVRVGGSENATVHGIIHESIAETLSSLTGISITIRGQNPEKLMNGVRQWRKWLADQDTR